MCLQNVKTEKPAPTGFGWKVFLKAGSMLRSENRGCRVYKHDIWYQATDGGNHTIQSSCGQSYPRGFHVALRRQDARNFLKSEYGRSRFSGLKCVIRKVEFRQAHTLGTGSDYFPGPQVVAEEIRIIRPAKGGSAYKKHNLTMQRLRGNIQP